MKQKLTESQKIIKKYRKIWGDSPKSILKDYSYLLEKTKELDSLEAAQFDRIDLYEIILWKIARFPSISDSLIKRLRSIKQIKPENHREAKDILIELLKCKNIALPMASTILRFLNPTAFQIIDDRAFRIVMPKVKKYTAKPIPITDSYLQITTDLYFEYIDKLVILSSPEIPFEQADRIFYQLDKKLGNRIGEI